jgi:hypothetical protein
MESGEDHMAISITELRDKVASQRTQLPEMYGAIDFSLRPERFTDEPDAVSTIRPALAQSRPRLLADQDQVARIEGYTLLGDLVGDAYAALIPRLGFKRLVDMLDQACDEGVEKVEGAPPELVAFIRDMERIPDWLDMELVAEGARLERNMVAHFGPFQVRSSFLATFTNKYAALPMIWTGALSEKSSVRRIKETAAFFTISVMPGALERFGGGFKAAAKVRLMHSMVRFSILRKGKWDSAAYGIPIPQVDQMPAGMAPVFFMSLRVLKKGRTEFTPDERARLELSRYRCYLLGLPEDLLAVTPQGIVDVMSTRACTLRDAWDDAICGELVRGTMASYLAPDKALHGRVSETFERSFSKFVFIKLSLDNDTARAAEIGIPLSAADRGRALAVALLVASRVIRYGIAAKIPGLRERADRRLVKKITRILDRLGHAEFTTDASAYRAERAEVA